MFKRLGSLLLLAIVPFALAQNATKTVIMPLGDAITGDYGCWRALVWTKLQQEGKKNIDFVGSLKTKCGTTDFDTDNEGHNAFQAVNIARQNQLVGWLKPYKVDIVLMHLGTGDIGANASPATITGAFSTLVDQMRDNNPNIKIVVSKIIPISVAQFATRITDLNKVIDTWAPTKNTTASPIYVVDQFTGYNAQSDNRDGVHPNDAGNVKIAAKYYPILYSLIP